MSMAVVAAGGGYQNAGMNVVYHKHKNYPHGMLFWESHMQGSSASDT